jgi:hypothetical protein
MDSGCAEVLAHHLKTGNGAFYRNEICINICRQNNVTIPEFKRYCTRLKREGTLVLEKDEGGYFYYLEPVN